MPNHYVIHYNLTIGTNVITGNATTIQSDPPATRQDAITTLTNSILATAPEARINVLGVKELTEDEYNLAVKIYLPR